MPRVLQVPYFDSLIALWALSHHRLHLGKRTTLATQSVRCCIATSSSTIEGLLQTVATRCTMQLKFFAYAIAVVFPCRMRCPVVLSSHFAQGRSCEVHEFAVAMDQQHRLYSCICFSIDSKTNVTYSSAV